MRHALVLIAVLLLLVGCGTPATLSPTASSPIAPAATRVPAEGATPESHPTAVPTTAQAEALSTNQQGCVEQYDQEVDYFPEKSTVEYSKLWSIEYANHYKVVRISTPGLTGTEAATPIQQTYVLVQCGTPTPDLAGDLQGATVVHIPAKRAVASYVEDVTALFELGLADRLVGIPEYQWLVDLGKPLPMSVIAAVDAGKTTVLSGETLSIEQVVSLAPDVVFAYSVYGFGDVEALGAAGVPVVGVLNAAEPMPLGDAEWAKFFAVFFNAEGTANRIIGEVGANYTQLAARARTAPSKPTAIMVSPYSAEYFEAHRNSWGARLIEDAGGANLLAGDGATAPINISPEIFVDVGDRAELWLTEFSRFDLGAKRTDLSNIPFDRFPSVQNKQVWNIGKATPAEQRYYGVWSTRPDLLLADVVAVLHPDLLPNHQLQILEPPVGLE